MNIQFRNYQLLRDFERVSEFLRGNFTKYQQNGNVQQPFWEYAHVHPYFNHKLAHRFGIWEENGQILAVACYEMDLGECFFIAKIGFEHLKPSLIEYAERELCQINEHVRSLDIWVFDYETELKAALARNGYVKEFDIPVTVFNYEKGFVDRQLPDGFTIISLNDENDYRKINDVLWRGFDHGDEPDDDLDCRKQMQSAPNFRKDLTTIIKAPNGEYACFAGMWVDGVNDFAYLEPLATDPKYRRMGLAAIALTEAMKKTVQYGPPIVLVEIVNSIKTLDSKLCVTVRNGLNLGNLK